MWLSGDFWIFTFVSQKHSVNLLLILSSLEKVLVFLACRAILPYCFPLSLPRQFILVQQSYNPWARALWYLSHPSFGCGLSLWILLFYCYTLGISVGRSQVLSSLPYYSQPCFPGGFCIALLYLTDTNLPVDSYHLSLQAYFSLFPPINAFPPLS